MKRQHNLCGILSAATLLAFSSYAAASCNGGYRWSEVKDGKTITHYTQQPPEGRASECVQISTGTRSQVNPGESDDASKPAGKSSADGTPNGTANGTPAKKPVGMQGVPDKDPEKCKQAKDTRTLLEGHARIREKADNGEYRYLSPDEIAEQKKLADESTEVYCD